MIVAAAPVLFLLLWWVPGRVESQSSSDGAAMKAIYESFKPDPPANWTSGFDYCNWGGVTCASGGKVTEIIIKTQNLRGSLSPELQTLSSLKRLEVQENQLTGAFPNLKGLASLDRIYAHTNQFSSFPVDDDFFVGLTSLSEFSIGRNPTLKPWQIPKTVTAASKLSYFEASNSSLVGNIPDYFNVTYMPSLTDLELGSNNLQGQLPTFFSGSGIQKLRLEGNNLTGNLDVLGTMTDLNEVHLNMNHFTGPLPDLSNLTSLQVFNVRDNQLTGVVPPSLINLHAKVVMLSNNLFQGPMPDFSGSSGQVDIGIGNSFCTDKVGQDCDPRVKILLNIAKDLGYPNKLAEDWQGNDPCQGKGGSWPELTCLGGNITGINFGRMSLAGTISSNFSVIKSLVNLKLNDNNLTGTIPKELADLPNLKTLDLSNNALYGQVPNFRSNVVVKVEGNPDIGKDNPSVPAPGTPSGPDSNKKSKTGLIVGIVVGSAVGLVFVGLLVFCLIKRKKKHAVKEQSPNSLVIHPRHSGDQNAVKITIANRFNGSGSGSESHNSPASHGPNDIHVEAGNMIISIQVLRSVTNNFSEDKILGKGGFGTVYEGELHDGTKIAVKRMESGVVAEKGLNEFKAEIAVLSKVRHRHLVGLLGYCLDGNEKLLAYEHMPQGNLTRHLFHWEEEGLEPLEWTKRLTIALDVARGVEYLHALANEIFIHRDLKPSNILLGDDMRAKVADFGLVRLAPAGKSSFETRLAGTFGYLAPEYAATGRMTLKVDVYSFGVILMELITGRKAIDESEPEDSCHLVTWFRRKLITTEAFPDVVDPTIDVNEETLSSIIRVAELAGHCSAREPHQRPDMGHAVNVLSSLVEQWKPSKQQDYDEMDAIDFNMPLKEAVKMWQASEGKSNIDDSSSSSTYPKSRDSTQSSIPDRASGFLTSFTSSDGR